MELQIDPELQKLIPPLTEDELKQLEDNLIKEGWRPNERIITWHNCIVDGHNRYKICKEHNITFQVLDKDFDDKNQVILWMIDNQLGRRNISDYAKAELGWLKADKLRLLAKEKQGFRSDIFQKSEKSDPIHVDKEIAKLTKLSVDTISRSKFIMQNAEEEIKAKLRSGNKELSINKVYEDLKAKEKRQNVLKEVKEAENMADIEKKYRIIYADPPWNWMPNGHRSASIHYPCMDLEAIKNLPVGNLAHDDCILFLWVIFPMLKESFEVMDAWGFRYVTCGFNWIKRTKTGKEWHIGLGQWTRANSELCLIATKGHPLRFSENAVSQVICTNIEEHSKKPDIVRDRIVELCGDLPRIELFARQRKEGWDAWGNQEEGWDAWGNQA